MPDCPYCGAHTTRESRGLLQKLVSTAAFRCTSCGKTFSIRQPWLSIFQRYAECPRCNTRNLARIFSRDRVDKMSRNPLRWLLGLFGFPLYHCIYCRYQFRDWRKRQSDERASSTSKA